MTPLIFKRIINTLKKVNNKKFIDIRNILFNQKNKNKVYRFVANEGNF